MTVSPDGGAKGLEQPLRQRDNALEESEYPDIGIGKSSVTRWLASQERRALRTIDGITDGGQIDGRPPFLLDGRAS